MKRLLDLLLALALLPAAVLIIGVTGLYVALVERIDPFFVQERLGRGERVFRILKMRTMHPTTEHLATHEAPASAVTGSGALLRRYKIDELPQLVNVLTGQMSFVGPRPGLPSQLELADARRARGVFAARPGITGLGQVLGVDMSTPVRLAELDARYLATRTLGLDLRILWQTLTGRGFGDRVVAAPGDERDGDSV